MSKGSAVASIEYMEQLNFMDNYSHLIEIDEKARRLIIYRAYESGKKELYTEVDLPDKTFDEDKNKFQEFARMLGENILMDSPVARKLLGL